MGLMGSLHRKLIALVLEKQGAFICPECREEFPPPPAAHFESFKTPFACPHCGHQMTLMELNQPDGEQAALREEKLQAEITGPPADTKIGRDILPGGLIGFRLPNKSESMWFLLGFSIFWLSISGTIFGVGLHQYWGDRSMESLGMVAFSSIFVIIGLFVLYAGLLAGFRRDTLLISPQAVALERKLFSHSKVHKLTFSEIESIEAKEFYQQNYQPVYGIEIRGPRRKLRFGSALGDEDRRWLVHELRKYSRLDQRN